MEPTARRSAVRRGAGAAVAAMVAGAGLLAGAASAAASNDQMHINLSEYGLTLPRGLTGPAAAKVLHIEVGHDGEGHVPSATLTVDTTSLAGVADVTWPKACTHTGPIGTCTIDHVDDVNAPDLNYLPLGLTASADAQDGDHGTVELKASAPGVQSFETSADISVGSGADLTLQQFTPVLHAKVGSTVPAPIRWSNTGNQTASSTIVTLQTTAGLAFTEHYSNCRYTKPSGPLELVTATCTIDTPLAPGKALKLSPEPELRVTSEAWQTYMDAQVLPPGAQPDAAHTGGSGTPGDGPRLTATAVPTPRVTSHTADINQADSRGELVVLADNHAHYSAIGDAVKGDKGRTVPITVGLRNSGPAFIFDRSGGENIDLLRVTLPQGTTVTKAPSGCDVADEGTKAHGPYVCGEFNSIYQAPGYKAEFTFRVHLDQQLSNARGSAVLALSAGPDEGKPAGRFTWDTSTAGYSAPIVVNGPAAGSQPGASGADGATNAPGPDGQSQSLAATGGGSHTPLIVGGAVAALVVGAGTLTVSRRRRTATQR